MPPKLFERSDFAKGFPYEFPAFSPPWCVCLLINSAWATTSSETQGQLVGAGERLNGRGKKSGEEKSRTKVGAPGILLLTDQFRNHLKSLPVIGHKNIFCAQSESSSFRVTFVTSYSKLSVSYCCGQILRACIKHIMHLSIEKILNIMINASAENLSTTI